MSEFSDWIEQWQERAAIMQYDGGMDKETAEEAATAWILDPWIPFEPD